MQFASVAVMPLLRRATRSAWARSMSLKRPGSCAATTSVFPATFVFAVLLFALLQLMVARASRGTRIEWLAGRRAHVIDHGSPFSFSLVEPAAGMYVNATVASAVSVDELRAVVFVVWDRVHSSELREKVLPVSWACEFNRTNGLSVQTVLRLRANGEVADRTKLTSSIWSCAWPRSGDWDRRSVRIVGPNRNVKGDGIFPLQEGRLPMAGLVACVKPVKNLGQSGETERRLLEYVRHYSSLGVEHFVLYINRDVEDSRALEHLKNVTVVRMAPELHERVFLNQTRKNRVQVFFVNDCLWRTRYRASWTMMQFDLDEFVIGTESLVDELAALPRNVSHLYIRHSLVKPPHGSPLLRDGIHFTNGTMRTLGKTIVRPDMVEVQWVHSPLLFSGEKFTAKSMRLLHFQADHYTKYEAQLKNALWSEYKRGLRFLR